MAKTTSKSDQSRAGMVYVGSIMLGVGIGWIIDPAYIAPGAVIGVGVGFILMARMRKK